MADLENGLDWADGLDGRNGTPTPDSAVQMFSSVGSDQPIEEMVDSPTCERAEQATLTHRFTMSWEDGLNFIPLYGRGTILTDSFGNITRVLSATIQRQGAKGCIFTIVAESLSFDTPPDEFEIVPVELGVNIIKYPRYFYAFLADGDGNPNNIRNQAVVRLLQNYFENPTSQFRDALTFQLFYSISGNAGGNETDGTLDGGIALPSPSFDVHSINSAVIAGTTIYPTPGTDLAKAAAIEIIQKYWRNEETPYVIGYQITWSAFYFRPPALNPGGYVEDPISEASPQLPEFFWSTSNPPDPSNTIFDLISTFNPQCYSSDGITGGALVLSWLRKADQNTYERTFFKIQRTWIGSPVGYWDPQLYNSNDRPSSPNDYLEASIPQVTVEMQAVFLQIALAAATAP